MSSSGRLNFRRPSRLTELFCFVYRRNRHMRLSARLEISLTVIALGTLAALAADAPAPAVSQSERIGWWRDARFGMFIHWGLYAIPAGEWKGQQAPGIGEWIM